MFSISKTCIWIIPFTIPTFISIAMIYFEKQKTERIEKEKNIVSKNLEALKEESKKEIDSKNLALNKEKSLTKELKQELDSNKLIFVKDNNLIR